MGRYVEENGIYYWVTDEGGRFPVDIRVPSTPMRRDFLRKFISRAAKIIRVSDSRIKSGNPLTERAKKWKKNQGIKSLTLEELLKKAKNKEAFIDQKVDGQTALMEYKNGKARFGSLGGRVHNDLPVLDEIEKTLKEKGVETAQIVGELAGYEDGNILPFRESQSFIKNPEKDKEKVHWFPYQILSIDGKEHSDDYESYIKSRSELDKIFDEAKYVHSTTHYKGGVDDIKKAWKKLVEKGKNEGIVVRLFNDEVYKVKPVFTYDLVIVAVGDKKLKAWPKKRIGNVLVAFMDRDKIFRTAGEIGTGWTEEQREELFKWAQDNKVSEDDHRVWVKPQKIVEVQWERSNIKDMPAYKYSEGEYERIGKEPVGTVVKPRFIRYRKDKSVNPDDLRLGQIPNWEERKKEAVTKPLSFNEFICRHVRIMIDDASPDKHFPPQRARMLYEKYKKLLAKGSPDALKYHRNIKPKGQSTNKPAKIRRMARRIIGRMNPVMHKQADYPDHPDEIVISKSENILDRPPINELDIWSYYEGIKGRLIPQFKGKDLFIVVKPDSKPVYIRHPYDKKTEFIRINDEKDFETYHSGRTVEYHITAESEVPFYAVDMDPPGTSEDDFNRAKKAAEEIADAMGKIDEVTSVSINYTGKRGFHIFGKLKKKKDVDDARKFIDEWLKNTFGDNDDYIIGESPKGGKIALGVAPLKVNGGHVALWSMRVSGLCCVEVPRRNLSGFKRSSATPEKVHKDLTGKKLKRIEKEKKMANDEMAKRVVDGFCSKKAFRGEFSPEPGFHKRERDPKLIRMLKELPGPEKFVQKGEEYLDWDGKQWVLKVK